MCAWRDATQDGVVLREPLSCDCLCIVLLRFLCFVTHMLFIYYFVVLVHMSNSLLTRVFKEHSMPLATGY